MFIYFSKVLPLFIYPVGLVLLLLAAALALSWRPNRRRWQRGLLLVALLVLWLGSTHWVSYALTRSLEYQYLPPDPLPSVDAIVVLGGGVEPQLAPRPLPEVNQAGDRMIYGAWLFHEGLADKIVLSGGIVPWLSAGAGKTEAESMADIMQMLGVPPEALLLEDQSRNTYENGVYTRELLSEMGAEKILLVTSAAHMPRSVKLFEAQGFEVVPAPTDFRVTEEDWRFLFEAEPAGQLFHWLPTAYNLYVTTVMLKEYVGMAVYTLRGWM